MSWRDRLERGRGLRVHVEADLRDQVVQALAAELPLHLREDGLDRVELGAVGDVVDGPDVQLAHQLSDIRVLVHPQVVHKQRDRPPPGLAAHLAQVDAKLRLFDRVLVDVHEEHAILLCHGGDRRPVANVNILLVHGQAGVLRAPLIQLDRPLREEGLVGEDYDASLALGLLHLRQQALAVLHEVAAHSLRHGLLLPHFLAPDPVPQVEASQGRNRDALVGEPPVEEDGPLLHRHPRPLLERVHAGQEVQMLRAELAQKFVATQRLDGPERGPADVLHLVV